MIWRPILEVPDLSAYQELAAKHGMMEAPAGCSREDGPSPRRFTCNWPGDAYYRCRNLLSYGGFKVFDLAHGVRQVSQCPVPGYSDHTPHLNHRLIAYHVYIVLRIGNKLFNCGVPLVLSWTSAVHMKAVCVGCREGKDVPGCVRGGVAGVAAVGSCRSAPSAWREEPSYVSVRECGEDRPAVERCRWSCGSVCSVTGM